MSARDIRYGRRGGGWIDERRPEPEPAEPAYVAGGWDRLVGMRCVCPPGCTTGDVWGDGPRDCDVGCEPCRLMAGQPYVRRS